MSLRPTASRRRPAAPRLKVQGRIGRNGGERDRRQIDHETLKAGPQDAVWYSNDGGGPQPDGENSQLNRSRNPDEVSATRIIRIGQPRRNANHGRDRKTRQRTFEGREMNRPSLDRGDQHAGGKRKRRADRNSSYSAVNQAPVAAPEPEADGKNFGKKRQEQGRNNDGDGIVLENT